MNYILRLILYLFVLLNTATLKKKIKKMPIINFHELCLQLFNLVCHSCQILHKFAQCPQLCWKGTDNPVTEVDYLIQYFIIQRIKQKYGSTTFKIVAQEDLDFIQCPQLKANVQIKHNQIKQLFTKDKVDHIPQLFKLNKEYNTQDLCFWIDPLDCTQGFINNRKYETTILLGISYKGTPICGIIGHPYKKQKNNIKYSYQPKVYFGFTEFQVKCAYQYLIFDHNWKILQNTPLSKDVRNKVSVGYRKMSIRQQKMIKKLNLECQRNGGAGYKCLQVIKKQIGSLFMVDLKTSKWDSCAGEAIIRSMGGHTIKPNLSQINYIVDQPFQNKQGFIFTLQTYTYNKIMQIVVQI